jgi:hypothetical protein
MAWLRHDPWVKFLDEPALVTAESLCDLRRRAWPGPTFVVLNGAYSLSVGDWPEVPRATRHLEAALARDLPAATAVLRIPRQTTAAWLTVYRVDSSEADQTDGGEACYVPTSVFDERWQNGGAVALTGEPLRMTTDRAGYAEGPLPQGWYTPIVWASVLPPDISVRVQADGQDLGPVEPVEQGGDGWRWVAPPKPVLVSSGSRIQLEFQVLSASPSVATDQGQQSSLVVRDVVLQRLP